MKIAFITDRISRHAGGLFDANKNLAQALHSSGEKVEIFGVSDECSAVDSKSWWPISVHLAIPLLSRNLALAPKLRGLLNRYSPDIVHLHGLWNYPSFLSWRWSRLNCRSEVIHPHGMLDPWALNNSRAKKTLALLSFERAHLNSAACIRALCEAELAAIRRIGIKVPVCVIPNGVDLPDFDFTQSSGGRTKRLLYLGRLHPKKGLAALIQAWHIFCKSYPSHRWILNIAGWGERDHENELIALAGELRLKYRRHAPGELNDESGSIVFWGPCFGKEKDALYKSSDAFILPSLSEGLPMVVLEAWAYSKPVIMTSECNLPLGFTRRAAVPIDPEVSSIVVGLRTIAKMSDEERLAMGTRGRSLAGSDFAWSSIGDRLNEVNRWLLMGGSKPDHVFC